MCPNVTCKDGSALLNDRRARKVRGRKGPLLKGCCSNVPVFILKAFQGGREGSYCLSVIKVEWLKIPFEGNLFSVSVVAHKIPDMQGKQAQENVAGGTGLRIRTPGLNLTLYAGNWLGSSVQTPLWQMRTSAFPPFLREGSSEAEGVSAIQIGFMVKRGSSSTW